MGYTSTNPDVGVYYVAGARWIVLREFREITWTPLNDLHYLVGVKCCGSPSLVFAVFARQQSLIPTFIATVVLPRRHKWIFHMNPKTLVSRVDSFDSQEVREPEK